MANPFKRRAMLGAPNWMQGVVVMVHVTLPTSRLSSTMIFVTLMVPVMSSAAAIPANAARNIEAIAGGAKRARLMTSSLDEHYGRTPELGNRPILANR